MLIRSTTAHSVRFHFVCFALTFGLMILCGCGKSGPKLYVISGSVSYNGQPVPAGTITFTPDSQQGNSGPNGFAKIENGKYKTSIGTVGGPHRITIRGLDAASGEGESEGAALFSPYTTTQDLPAEDSTIDFEVPQ